MWQKADRVAAGLASVLAVTSTTVIFLLGILQVVFRFMIKISVPWTEELMRALYIYLVFFGVILIERENTQIRTTMFIERLPYKLYNLWEIVVSLGSILFNVVLLIGSVIATRETISYLGSLPHVSMKIFYIPILISCPLMVLYQFYHLAGYARKVLSGEKEEKQ